MPLPPAALDPSPPPTSSSSSLLHRTPTHIPPTVLSATSSTLTLSHPPQKEILDACAGAAVSCLGHTHPAITTAALTQMRQISYTHSGFYTTAAAESLATTILSLAPPQLQPNTGAKCLFLSSGSEATEAALKVARQHAFNQEQLHGFPPRTNFVSRKQSYHGATIGAMSLSSNLPRKIPFAPLQLPNVSFISPAFAYHYSPPGETESDFAARLVRELEAEFLRLGPETVIAFVAETVTGATTGCVAAPGGYFRGVRRLCDRYGILMVLDEVMCGCGRTGTFFAFEQEGEDVVPDIVTIGKGLGGGFAPLAGVVVAGRVVRGLGEGGFNHGHTYQAHPVGCAIAGAVVGIIKEEGLVERVKVLGGYLGELLTKGMGGKRFVGDVRGRGLFWGVEFVRDKGSREPFEPERDVGGRVQTKASEMGVAVYPGKATVDGVRGDHVLLAPAYTVAREEVETMVRVLGEAYDVVEGELVEELGSIGVKMDGRSDCGRAISFSEYSRIKEQPVSKGQ